MIINKSKVVLLTAPLSGHIEYYNILPSYKEMKKERTKERKNERKKIKR